MKENKTEEMIKYNGKMMPYSEYEAIQKKLYYEMVNRKNDKPAEILTLKQKYGTNKLNAEAGEYLYLQIVKFLYERLAQYFF